MCYEAACAYCRLTFVGQSDFSNITHTSYTSLELLPVENLGDKIPSRTIMTAWFLKSQVQVQIIPKGAASPLHWRNVSGLEMRRTGGVVLRREVQHGLETHLLRNSSKPFSLYFFMRIYKIPNY